MNSIGRPSWSGAEWVRIQFYPHRSTKLFIGRLLWYQLAMPSRIELRRNRSVSPSLLWIRPTEMLGFAVSQPPNGMPHISIGRDRSVELGLLDGRFAALIDGTTIVVDLSKPIMR